MGFREDKKVAKHQQTHRINDKPAIYPSNKINTRDRPNIQFARYPGGYSISRPDIRSNNPSNIWPDIEYIAGGRQDIRLDIGY